MQRHRQDLPWAELDLDRTAGPLHRRQDRRARRGRAPLPRVARRGGQRKPPRSLAPPVAKAAATRTAPCSRSTIAPSPGGLVTSCPVAAALERVGAAGRSRRAAAARHRRTPLRPCRQLFLPPPLQSRRRPVQRACHGRCGRYPRLRTRRRSADLACCATGTARPEDAAFLRAARDGACRVFAPSFRPTTMPRTATTCTSTPADRGPSGWRACR